MTLLRICLSLGVASQALFACAQRPALEKALAAQKNLSSLHSLLTEQMPDLMDELDQYSFDENPITILAPSNAAFDMLPNVQTIGQAIADNKTPELENIFRYHVLEGLHWSQNLNSSFNFYPSLLTRKSFTNVTGGQRVGAVLQSGEPPEIVFTSGLSTRSVASKQDITFKGGVIHQVDAFAIPPLPFVDTASEYNLANMPDAITSFLGAVYAHSNASLPRLLNTTKDVTIFAPANVAFEMVRGAVTSMPGETLNDILSYHVVLSDRGPIYSSNFSNATTYQTLQGANVTMSFSSNSFFLNSARILTSDVLIGNGVIHIIDNVLSPNVTSVMPNPTSFTQAPVLPATGVSDFNRSMAPFTTYLPGYVPDAPSSSSETTSASNGVANESGGVNGTLASATRSSSRTSTESAASTNTSFSSAAALSSLGQLSAVAVISLILSLFVGVVMSS